MFPTPPVFLFALLKKEAVRTRPTVVLRDCFRDCLRDAEHFRSRRSPTAPNHQVRTRGVYNEQVAGLANDDAGIFIPPQTYVPPAVLLYLEVYLTASKTARVRGIGFCKIKGFVFSVWELNPRRRIPLHLRTNLSIAPLRKNMHPTYNAGRRPARIHSRSS